MEMDARLQEARDGDAQVWDVLLAHGMVAGRALEIESVFVADDEAVVGALTAALAGTGATTAAEPFTERAGLFRRVTRWSVLATVTLPAADLAAVQALSEQMLRAGDTAGAGYDGWSASVPEA